MSNYRQFLKKITIKQFLGGIFEPGSINFPPLFIGSSVAKRMRRVLIIIDVVCLKDVKLLLKYYFNNYK